MSQDNVVILGGTTKLNIPTERVLNGALKANLKSVVLVGIEEDGKYWFASSYGHAPDALWDLKIMENYLLEP